MDLIQILDVQKNVVVSGFLFWVTVIVIIRFGTTFIKPIISFCRGSIIIGYAKMKRPVIFRRTR